jgi:2-(1,2-epoxy-1,2-dihydrophenyl)acetyl-CoA isomerase
MTESPLIVRRDRDVTVLELNRPASKNALTGQLVRVLLAALAVADADPGVRVVMLTGAGDSFCSGADLKAEILDDPDGINHVGERIEAFHGLIRAILACRKPIIAAVDGAAVGYGCDLAVACDLRIVSPRSYFQERFVRVGLMPDGGGTFLLPRLVGVGRALEMILFGDRVLGEDAVKIGLANRLVPNDMLMTEAMQFAHSLALGPPLAFAKIKQAIWQGVDGTLDEALAREKAGQISCLRSDDCAEGLRAWSERREPVFKGH